MTKKGQGEVQELPPLGDSGQEPPYWGNREWALPPRELCEQAPPPREICERALPLREL